MMKMLGPDMENRLIPFQTTDHKKTLKIKNAVDKSGREQYNNHCIGNVEREIFSFIHKERFVGSVSVSILTSYCQDCRPGHGIFEIIRSSRCDSLNGDTKARLEVMKCSLPRKH